MNRKQFIKLGIAAGLASYGSAQALGTKNQHQELVSAFDKDNQHFVGKFDLETGSLLQQQIPFRAHDILPIGGEQVLSFGRRPMTQCVFSDLKSQQQTLIEADNNRHFYGHGCLDKTETMLFTTENDFENAQGKIGIRDAQTFKQIGEYSSYGVGPHDIHLMPDNKTLVIANGGIQTHPDFGRRKLNLKTMQPSLVFIDSESGQKLDEYRMQNSLLSIRHLSVTDDGSIGVSTQYQGNLYQQVPNTLLAWFDGNELIEFKMNQETIKQCQGYIADVAVDTKQQVLAATSPRGNNVSFWDIKSKTLVETIEIAEPSGIIFDTEKQSFLVSNANGVIHQIAQNHSKFIATPLHVFPGMTWDNHMIMKS